MYRPWAFWRRVQYGAGVSVFFTLSSVGIYFLLWYTPPTCFDGVQNGDERGVDCGGACVRVCPFEITQPAVRWSRSFEIVPGLYNAVAYVENRNTHVGTRDLKYTFTLLDDQGVVIAEKSGKTFLPPDSVYPIFEGRITTGEKRPVQTVFTINEEPTWEPLLSSRDQFEIKDRALTSVDFKPRLEASIFNTALTDARTVEVVATIFDMRGTALTASRTEVPLFRGRETERVVFSWPEPIAKTLRSCEVPSDVVLAIDLSGSMNNDGGTPPQPITSVLEAAEGFASRLKTQDQLSLVTFATNGSLHRTLSRDKTALSIAIEGLRIDPKEERGGTNIGDAIERAREELASARHSADARKVLVLFTDGKANEPGENGEVYALTAAEKIKKEGVTIFTIGLGSEVNAEFLGGLASSPESRYLASNRQALDQIYKMISSAICEDGPAVIDIVPKVTGALNDGR